MRILLVLFIFLPSLGHSALSYDALINGLIVDNNNFERKKFSAVVRINQDEKFIYKYTRSESEHDLDIYTSNQFSLVLNESSSGAMEVEFNRFESTVAGIKYSDSNYRVDIIQFRKDANVGYNYNSDPAIPLADAISQATSIYWSNFFTDNAMLDVRYVMPRNSSGLREGTMLGLHHAPSYFANYLNYSFSIFKPNKLDPMIIRLGIQIYMGKAKNLKQITRNRF